jgi:hypothetical protein
LLILEEELKEVRLNVHSGLFVIFLILVNLFGLLERIGGLR